MDWARKQHPVESLVEWLAPAVLAVAVAWSAVSAGFNQAIVVIAPAAAFAVGRLAIGVAGRRGGTASPSFEPVPLEAVGGELDELLLDNPLPEVVVDSELLLDDPLTDIAEDARVVRLFSRQEPTPGELVARIEDFLGDGERRASARPETAQAIPDAGAALQAALANVRASLR